LQISFLTLVSHLVTIPPGPHILSDILISSPIISEDSGSGPISTGTPSTTGTPATNFAAFGGVDPNIDPELALVIIKVSVKLILNKGFENINGRRTSKTRIRK
jgi:hypothetical protein